MTEVHLLLPAGYDDATRPSGGNRYDTQLRTGLADHGWDVITHEIPGSWPSPDAAAAAAVGRRLALVPPGRVVIVDGLLCTAATAALVEHASRLLLVPLVHMPGAPGGPPAAVLRAARLVVTTSGWTARALVEQHRLDPRAVVVAPPGVVPAELAAGTATGGALLCVAAVTRLKGHDVLVRALTRLAGEPWTCRCVGDLGRDPAFVGEVHHLLAANGLTDRVELAGTLVGSDLGRAYAAADVLVLPTRTESYGMVVTEALARGLPVIAAAVGGVPEALGHAPGGRRPGLLVQAGADLALAAALRQWLTDPALRGELRAAARSRRALLTGWERTAATVATAIARLTID